MITLPIVTFFKKQKAIIRKRKKKKLKKINALCKNHALMTAEAPAQATARCFMLFQVAFSLPIDFSTSLEDSVIKMKPASPVPVDTAVNLKA